MLRWNGSGFLHGIPARDLQDDELDQYGGKDFLLKTGLYDEDARPAKMVMPKKMRTTLADEKKEEGE